MFRKSALAMAMLGALTAQEVAALGLGEIELRSALNQPLLAEVELVSATPTELNELKVAIASSQAFEDAGIERPLFLTKLKFNVDKNDAGRPVVQITSRDAVREPFLDFLLELSWSKGKLVREYTVLVDPPVTMPAPMPVSQVPVARTADASSSSMPVSSARRVQHTAQMPPVSVLTPGEYRTERNDTLWKVADLVRPDANVSMEQTMLGLLRTNPDAFYDNNINNLKAGYVLRVPTRDEMTSISQAQALQETRAQYQAWRQARQTAPVGQPAESVPATPSGVTTEAPAGAQLQLVAPELSDSSGSGVGNADDARELDILKRDLMMANEALEAQRRQDEEMSGRMAVLEEQIRNMQRLVQLKDDQLAQLQAQVADETGTPLVGEAPAETEVTDAAGMEEVSPAEDAVTELVSEEMATDGDAQAEVVDTPLAETETPAESIEPEVVAQVVPEELVGAASQPDALVEPAAPETSTTPGLVEQILANPLWLGAGGVLLALLAFFGLRKKRAGDTGFEESILQASRGAQSADEDGVSGAVRGSSESNETSLLSEFAVSDMGSIKSGGEADPLAEADVYLAYGRFQQAEDLISEALENKPDDEDLNLKLLEVFLAAKNQSSFDAHAQSLLGRLTKGGDSLWEKVSEMGRELNPANPMYDAGAVTAEDIETAEAKLQEELEDFDASGVAADSEFDRSAEAKRGDEPGLDFDIDLSYNADVARDEDKPDSMEFTPPETSADVEFDMDSVEPGAIVNDNALDFDLEGLDLSGGDEPEGGDGELTDLDEVSTKLDLARAYIDMGDPDGARSILDEVLEEGSDEQVSEAKGIMEQIS